MPYVLVADDDPDVRRMVQVNLERHGYRVETAESGGKALASIEADRPDLLILDCNMSDMGYEELMARVRNELAITDLPVILLSDSGPHPIWMMGHYERERYEREHGPIDMYSVCMTKPFNPQELLQFVKRTLGSTSEGDGEAQQPIGGTDSRGSFLRSLWRLLSGR